MPLNITSKWLLQAGVAGEDSVRKFTGTVQTLDGASNRLRNTMGALGVSLSVAAFANMIKGSIDAADRMRDLSQATGVTVETLSGLDLIAKKSGIGIETVARAIAAMSKVMAATPEKFKPFGITVNEINKGLITQQEAIARISGVLSKMPDGWRKSAIAQELFGKAGREMIPLVNEGVEAIRKANGYMTTDFAKAADAFNDKWEDVKNRIDATVASLAESMLPAMDELAEAISSPEFQAGLKDFTDFLVETGKFLATYGKEFIAFAAAYTGMKAGAAIGGTFGGARGAAIGGAIGGIGGGAAALYAMPNSRPPPINLGADAARVAATYPLYRGAGSPPGSPSGSPYAPPTAAELAAAKAYATEVSKALAARNKIGDRVRKDRQDEAKADLARATALEDFIKGLEFEAKLTTVAIADRQVLVDIERARELAGLKAGEALQKGDEDRIRAAEKLKSVNDAAQKKAEESAQEWGRIWDHASEGIQDSITGAFRSAIDGGTNSFRDFAASLKSLFFDVAAQIASALVFKPFIGSIEGALGIGSGGAGGAAGIAGLSGGIGAVGGAGLLGGLGAGLAGLSLLRGTSLQSSLTMGNIFQRGAGFLGGGMGVQGAAGRAGVAFGDPTVILGSFAANLLVNQLLGNRGIGSQIGSSAGGILGAFAGTGAFGATLGSLGGPAGTIIGSVLGNVVGGLFGNKSSVGPNAGGPLTFAGERFGVGTLGADNGGSVDQIRQVIETAAAALNALTSLPQFGVDPAKAQAGSIAQQINTFGFAGIKGSDDLIKSIISRGMITGFSEAEKSMLASSQNIGASIQSIVGNRLAGPALAEALTQSILQFTNPRQGALRNLVGQQEAFRAELEASGLFTGLRAQVEQLEDLQIAEVMKRFVDNVGAANDNFVRASQSIGGFLSNLTASTASPLPISTVFENARNEFTALVADARAGGASRIATLAPDILDAAGRYNTANRELNASSPQFFNGFNAMTATLQSLRLTLDGPSASEQALVTLSADQLSELQAIRTEIRGLRAAAEAQAAASRLAADAA